MKGRKKEKNFKRNIKLVSTCAVCHLFLFFSFFFFCLFVFFRATPPAHGSSQTRGPIGAATATATGDPSGVYNPHHSSPQHQILNPLSQARDRTHVLTDASQFHYHCATTGTPTYFYLLRIQVVSFCLDFPFLLNW